MVGLVGEAGIGKTRLADEAVALAEQRRYAGDPLLLWHAHNLNIICLVWEGHHKIVREHASAALALARELGVTALALRSRATLD